MKRNVMGLFLLAALVVASVRAEEGVPEVDKVAASTDPKGILSSVFSLFKKPVDLTKTGWNNYPHVAGGVATFVAVWAACRVCKPLGKALFGCSADSEKRNRAEYII